MRTVPHWQVEGSGALPDIAPMQRAVYAVPEEVVRLRVNGRLVAAWTCSPVALEALFPGLFRDLFDRSPSRKDPAATTPRR
jgi:hypothetical protein